MDKKISIEVLESTKNILDVLKAQYDSYDDVITRFLPEGMVSPFEDTYEEPPALELEVSDSQSPRTEKVSIRWSDLKDSEVGDNWSVFGATLVKPRYKMEATVIYRDESSCLVRIGHFDDMRENYDDLHWFAVYSFFK